MKFVEIIMIGIIGGALFFYVMYGVMMKRYKKRIKVRTDYKSHFNEDVIDPVLHDKLMNNWDKASYHDFYRHTLDSMQKSKKERIVFVGLCQDDGYDVLKAWMPIIEKMGGYFEDYRIVIVENDSKDNTRAVLLRAARKNPKITILCSDYTIENAPTCKLGIRSIQNHSDKETKLEYRIHILAHLRQVYWDHVKSKYPDYQYMCVIDWDLCGKMSIPGFFHGLNYTRSDYTDVIACNSYCNSDGYLYKRYQIYDTYPLLNHYRCEHLKKNKKNEDDKMNQMMVKNVLYNATYPVAVESAFGGVAIYNMQRMRKKNPEYNAGQICSVECEHTTFHRNLEVNIDPWMTFYIEKNMH